jgi:hypothetical protein
MALLDKTAQAIDSAPVTPSDTVPITDSAGRRRISDGISVAVAGNLAYLPAGVSEQGGPASTIITGLGAGMVHPLRAIQILATGTTATGVTAWFT